MAVIRSADQISIVDVTDAYSVILTSEAYTFPGTTNAAKAGSTTTQIMAMCGANIVKASVVVSEITKPTGVTVSSNGDATSPTLTISVSTAVTSAGVVKIPVHIGDVVINKEFSFAIAFTGANGSDGKGIKSTVVTYVASSSGTSIPASGWGPTIPSVSEGQYLWTKTTTTYTDNSTTDSYSVGRMGTNGTNGSNGKGIVSTTITYQASTSGTTVPTGTWSASIPSVAAGQFLWTRTVTTYTEGDPTTSYSVGMMGEKGATGEAGADAITLKITSSNGVIFKNSAIETVLTAHVYKAGDELNETEIAAIGAVKWYKDGGATAVATGITLTIDAGDVTNKATYTAQLEG